MRHNIVEFAIDLWQSCMGILRVQKRGYILLRIYFRFHKRLVFENWSAVLDPCLFTMFCKCFNDSGNWAPSRLRFFVERLTSSQPIANFRFFGMEIQNTIKPPLSCLFLSPPQSLLLLTINLDT